MEKINNILKRIMLALFMLLMAAAVLEGSLLDMEHKSYTVALVLAVLCLGAYCVLLKKLPQDREYLCDRLGAVKTGVIIGIIYLVINLGFVFLCRIEPYGDYASFWLTAMSVGTGNAPIPRYIALFPHILGYASFLGTFIKLFGASSMLAPILNVILTLISGVIIYVLCLRWRGLRAGAFAFLLWSFCPSKTLYNIHALSEPLYTCLILLFILMVTELDRRVGKSSVWLFPAAGAVCGLVLVCVNAARPIAAVPIIAFFIWLVLLRDKGRRDVRANLSWAACALLLCGVYIFSWQLWQAHAEKAIGEPPAFHYGYSVSVGFNTESMGSYNEEEMAMLGHYFYDEELTAPEAQAHMLEDVKVRLSSGEINFPRLFAAKIRTLIGDDEGGAFCASFVLSPLGYSALAVLSNIFYYALVILAIVGSLRLWKSGETGPVLIAPMYILGLCLAHMLVEVAGRYHYSIIPMLIILAAFSCKPTEDKLNG